MFHRDQFLLSGHADLDGFNGAMADEWLGEGERVGRDSGLPRSARTLEPRTSFKAMGPLGRESDFHLDNLTLRRSGFARCRRFPGDQSYRWSCIIA